MNTNLRSDSCVIYRIVSEMCRSSVKLFQSVLIQSHLFTPVCPQKRSTTEKVAGSECSFIAQTFSRECFGKNAMK